ncbi:hypothetical protein CERSUDRAFT_27472, partial [Gelatoporia subvermispora B]
SISALESFFLSMSIYVDVQKRVQEQLDRVAGPRCLPSFGDRPHLPYIEGVIHEVYRWNPAASL